MTASKFIKSKSLLLLLFSVYLMFVVTALVVKIFTYNCTSQNFLPLALQTLLSHFKLQSLLLNLHINCVLLFQTSIAYF